jgi:hypothetical protein
VHGVRAGSRAQAFGVQLELIARELGGHGERTVARPKIEPLPLRNRCIPGASAGGMNINHQHVHFARPVLACVNGKGHAMSRDVLETLGSTEVWTVHPTPRQTHMHTAS